MGMEDCRCDGMVETIWQYPAFMSVLVEGTASEHATNLAACCKSSALAKGSGQPLFVGQFPRPIHKDTFALSLWCVAFENEGMLG